MNEIILRDKRSGLEVEKTIPSFAPMIEMYVDDGKWCYKKLFILDHQQADGKYVYLFSLSKRSYKIGTGGGWRS